MRWVISWKKTTTIILKTQYMNTQPFEIERTYNAPATRVWKAITDKDQMKQWYFDLPAFKPEVGTEFTFEGGTPEKTFLHICVVKEVIEGKKISYSWRYDGYEGDSLVTFELFPEDENRTRVKLTHAGLHTFGAHPELAESNFKAGWTGFIDKRLKEFVEK